MSGRRSPIAIPGAGQRMTFLSQDRQREDATCRQKEKTNDFQSHGITSPLRRFGLTGCRTQLLARRGHGYTPCVDTVASVFSHSAIDDDFVTKLHCGARPSAILEAVGRAHFKAPIRRSSVSILDIDVEPNVRIRPFYLCDIASHLNDLARVVLCGKRMVCHCRAIQKNYSESEGEQTSRGLRPRSPGLPEDGAGRSPD